MGDDMLTKLARAMCRELGLDYDTLYENKAEYIADRGSRHDVNAPHKPDAIAAVKAVITGLSSPTEGMLEAGRRAAREGGLLPAYTDETPASKAAGQPPVMQHIIEKHIWPAMLSHVLNERGEG